jgi:uncharacterized protein (TIGR03790 family)
MKNIQHGNGLILGLVLGLIMALTPTAMALEPAEVLVVANANVPASEELARYYLEQRDIPEANLVLLNTSDAYDVSPHDYETTIRKPIQDALLDHDQDPGIRAICVMWGVPVRVTESVEDLDGLGPFLTRQAERAKQRLAIDRELLDKVGVDLTPPTKSNSLRLADTFAGSPTVPRTILPVHTLNNKINEVFKEKEATLLALTNEADRTIAYQQMMAMRMELNGLEGLIEYVETTYDDRDELDVAKLERYRTVLTSLQAKADVLADEPDTQETYEKRITYLQWIGGASAVAEYTQRLSHLRGDSEGAKASASVDSELAVLWYDTNVHVDSVRNPLHWARPTSNVSTVLITSRIDGPSAEDARSIIDRSIAAEATGLDGVFYIDAGMPERFANKPLGYIGFVRKLEGLSQTMKDETDLEVVLDKEPKVFQPKEDKTPSCTNASLYVGWYSLKRYVDAFEWNPGAVAYHVSSFDAQALRNPDANQWCGRLIQKGAAATIGAVDEPYLSEFPDHEAFFLLLLTGDYTIGECYWRSIPSASWRMTLIADPLYNPFKENPQIDATVLPPRLLPGADWQPLPIQHQHIDTSPTAPPVLPEEVPVVLEVIPPDTEVDTPDTEPQTEEPVPNDRAGALGDFNHDGVVDAIDIGLLSAAIDAGDADISFDITGDGVVDSADLVAEAKIVMDAKENGDGPSDSSIDGVFD